MSGIFESDCPQQPLQHLHLTDEETEALRTQEHCLRSPKKLGAGSGGNFHSLQKTEKSRNRSGNNKLQCFGTVSNGLPLSSPPLCLCPCSSCLVRSPSPCFIHAVKSTHQGQQKIHPPKGVILWLFHLPVFSSVDSHHYHTPLNIFVIHTLIVHWLCHIRIQTSQLQNFLRTKTNVFCA